MTEKEWYDNKTLYDMMVDLSKRLDRTSAELKKTQVLIRDYNGLRQKINECERALFENHGKEAGGKNVWGYVVGGIGILLALISHSTR